MGNEVDLGGNIYMFTEDIDSASDFTGSSMAISNRQIDK
jgi:hypothetical protein